MLIVVVLHLLCPISLTFLFMSIRKRFNFPLAQSSYSIYAVFSTEWHKKRELP